MIDGVAGRPFSALTLPPLPMPKESERENIIKVSRERYGVKREIVEEKIKTWTGFLGESKAPSQAHLPSQGQQPLYDATCSMCGKPTKVIFQPEKNRPIYCKTCLKKIKQPSVIEEKKAAPVDRKEEAPKISLKEALEKEVVSFSPSKKPQAEKDKIKRKEVNIDDLKKAIEESLEEVENKKEKQKPQKEKKEGTIEPGQTVKFK